MRWELAKKALIVLVVFLGITVIVWISFSGGGKPGAFENRRVSTTTNSNQPPESKQFMYLKTGGRCVELKIAQSGKQRRIGLSNHKRLAKDSGMIFLYEKAGRYGFWMKDMDFAIDIIWLTEDNRVVGLKREARPESFPKMFRPDKSAKKVIEVVSGFTKTENINFGDRLKIFGPSKTQPATCG